MDISIFLKDHYDITIKNDLINCTELIKMFNLKNVSLTDYKSKKRIKDSIYINNVDSIKFILNNNIKELLFLTDAVHQCSKCKKIFSSNQNLQLHHKKECFKHKCIECDKQYSSRPALIVHKKTKKHIDAVIRVNAEIHGNNNIINSAGKNIDNSTGKNIDNSTGKNIDNSTGKTVNNIIIVVPRNDFYDANLWNDLTNEEQLGILKSKSDCIKSCIKAIHFGKDKPMRHNVMSSNFKEKRGAIYTEGEWQSKNLAKIATELMENRAHDVKLILEEHKLSLSPEDIKKVNDCLGRVVNVSSEEILELQKNTANMNPIQAHLLSTELLSKIAKVDKNKKELCKEIQLIILDYTKKLNLKK